MALGKPALNVPRTKSDGSLDQRALAQFMVNVAERITAIEKAFGLNANQDIQSLLQNLQAQADGLVVKSNGVLTTRVLVEGAGVTITDPGGVKGNPSISAP